MIVDLSIVPGLLLLAAELVVLAAVGFVVVRVALGQTDDRLALAQGLVVGLAVWGLIVNFAIYVIPGLAGALVGWVVTLTIGAGLAWRRPKRIRPKPRVAAGIAVAVLALFWIALAGRQLVPSPDWAIHSGLISTIHAGGPHPPELPWHPGLAAPYHYGADLLVGLLTPPIGPDSAFATELLSAYIWVSYALIVGVMLLRHGWLMAVLAPLLLSAGTQTFLFISPGVLQVPVPAGIPAPGLRASLASIYVDGLGESTTSPPNIWKPFFVLAYALALVVLERVANRKDGAWLQRGVLALLVGFLGLVDEAVAPIVLGLWGVLEVVALVQARRARSIAGDALGAAAGPALAALLLAAGGGVLTRVLSGGDAGALSLGWTDHTSLRPPLASFAALPGGIGVLSLGPLLIAGGAVLLAGRNRLSLALAAGSGAFLVAALTLQYEYGQHDVTRLDGHARNFALLALLLALSLRLRALQPRWRYAAAAVIVALVAWPAIVSPVRNLGTAVGRGVQLANAQRDQQGNRQVFTRFTSARVAAYIRDHTDIDARVLSRHPTDMSNATGRPNASGFTQAVHYVYGVGPEFSDAIRYLEPAAVRRLAIAYVHTTDTWIASLPDRARRWLNDPRLFERLVADGTDALFRVRPAFLELEVAPVPESYEALRQAVPPSATVYFAPATEEMHALRLASALAHARPVGELRPGHIHLRTDFGIEPLGENLSSLVVAPRWFTPAMFPPELRQPVWWNDWVAAYSPDGVVEPIMPFAPAALPPLGVEVSDGQIIDERVRFTVRLTNRDPDLWNGQDWLVLPMNASVPTYPGFGGPSSALWFAGNMASWQGTQRHSYEFDPRAGSLAVRADDGRFALVGGGDSLGPGRWTLALRLIRAVHRGTYVAQEQVAFIPVMQMEISESGDVAYEVYEGDLGARLRP